MLLGSIYILISTHADAQYSIARRWNNIAIEAIKGDLARPPVQARNLFLLSVAMYDAWAAYDPLAKPYLHGNVIGMQFFPPLGTAPLINNDTLASREMAISYAAYRTLIQLFANSPSFSSSKHSFDTLMYHLGYDTNNVSINYQNTSPAELGNYIAFVTSNYGFTDGSNQGGNYASLYYQPVNAPLYINNSGNSIMTDVNRWQPLEIPGALDQGGNPVPPVQKFIGPEWGNVLGFALPSPTIYSRDGNTYKVYSDPGAPPMLHLTDTADESSKLFKWGHTQVAIWASHLDPNDTTLIDISPAHYGNTEIRPLNTLSDYQNYYQYIQGGDTGKGYNINPITNQPYTSNIVKRGDYTRIISQYWADGPESETPPGHWFNILHKVSDHPLNERKIMGLGPTLNLLEWDIKSYFVLGGALHDAAIMAWATKGWYDHPRPISMIRKMADFGQSTDASLANFHPAGIPLLPGYIEIVQSGDSLAGTNNQHVGKIKLYSWRGFNHIADSTADVAGVGWILAENWIPYQRKTFVTPPFGGYVSGHSTYSRAGAQLLSLLTGSEFFPGGIYEHVIPANSGFLQFEQGPSDTIRLQWARYFDASNEASLSRIWGGIHPCFDDMSGRLLGEEAAINAFHHSKLFFNDIPNPLTLHSFYAIDKDCAIILNWQTENEHHIVSYELWHTSSTGKQRFIARIDAKGNDAPGIQQYSVRDTFSTREGIYYLVETDQDHQRKVINHTSARFNNCKPEDLSIDFYLYPNPVVTDLHLKISGAQNNEEVKVIISDLGGREVYSTQINYIHQNPIQISSLQAGTYMLSLYFQDGLRKVAKFSKINP